MNDEETKTRELTRHPLVPRDKMDMAGAEAAVRAGYPAVAPVVPQLLEWVQDGNWPVAPVVAPLLAGIGSAIAPDIERVLASADDTWKYWVLTLVVARSPDLLNSVRSTLIRIVGNPTAGERARGVVEAAQNLLDR